MSLTVILDTDLAMGAPGSDVDDGFALAMALADPGIDLQLVTTVYGNTDVDRATALSHELLGRLGRSVPVVRGAAGPLRSGAVVNPAVEAIIERVLAAPGEVTLVPIGPLTNVALAIRAEPRFAAALGGLVIMGGLFAGGPVRREVPGEFNVWNDPAAAQIVLDAPVRARWVGLDVTRRVRLTRNEAVQLAASSRPFESFAGRYTVAWIDHLAAESRAGESEEPADSCALHDPLAVAVLTRPELVTFRSVRLDVGLEGDVRGVFTLLADGEPNADIGVDVDSAGFVAHLGQLLRRAHDVG